MTDPPTRRDRHDIVAEILKTAVGGKNKTHIMYNVKMSYSQVNTYLSLLIKKGLLENTTVGQKKKNKTAYRTTPKGMQLLQNLESTNKLWARRPTADESE